MAHGRDDALAHRAVEHLVVLGLQARRVDDVAVLGDVGDDRLDLLVLVAEALEGARDGAVDDLHRAAADELLELDQGEVGLDAGGVAVHHQADGAGRGEHRGLGVAETVLRADAHHVLPGPVGGQPDRGVQFVHRDGVERGVRVLLHDLLVGGRVAGVAVVRADDAGEFGAAAVGGAGHQRGDGAGQGAAALAVVGVAGGHQQGAEVGVADAELAVGAGGLADLLGREVGEADGDVHRGDDQLDDLGEALGVEAVVVAQELHQVERGEVAAGVVQVHVLGAGVGRVDAAGLRAGVPVVDGGVVLDSGVGAGPGGLGHLAEQLLRVDGLDDLAGHPGAQAEFGAVLDGGHEFVGDADGVVGVLVLDGGDVVPAEVHVEARVAQGADLLLLLHLGLDEGLDVRVVDVEHDHLGRAAGGATGLDGAGGGVGAAHEGDRAGGVAAGGQQFLGGADPGEVEAGAGAALEDHALFLVPVEDRLHGVVDGQDEAGADLLGLLGADVEPDRRVEAEHLVEESVRQLVLEDVGVVLGGEVAVLLAGGAVGEHHAVDDLLEAPLALRGADGAAEVLGRDDVDGVDRPEVGELDAALLEVDRPVTPVGHDDVTPLPADRVVRVHARSGVDALHPQAALRGLGALGRGLLGLRPACGTARGVCHFSLLLLGKRPECPEKSGHCWFVLPVCGQAETLPVFARFVVFCAPFPGTPGPRRAVVVRLGPPGAGVPAPPRARRRRRTRRCRPSPG